MATELWRELFMKSGVLDRLKASCELRDNFESINIMGIFEQTIFLWLANDQQLIAVTVKNPTDKEELCDRPQTLLLLNPPSFDVENIEINGCGHLISLSGKRGVTIVQLPQRWSGQDVFEGGKENIMCKSWNIADRYFSCSKRIKILQVSWHPGSNAHSHLVVLSNENNLRIYNVVEPQTPVLCMMLGSQSQSFFLTSQSQMTFYDCLGEVAVSFDFGPAIIQPDEIENSKDVEREDLIWPIFILNGNGDIYVLDTYLGKKIRNHNKNLLGPLSMHPPAEDNYGVDACNLICLQSSPPVLVITTCAGILYHCIVLHTLEFEDQKYEGFTKSGTSPDIGLFVFESVELALSLTQGDEMSSYPVRLCKDPTQHYRYHCVHSSGLHAVQLPFLEQIENFTSSDEGFESSALLNELNEKSSLVEHLICTRPFSSSPSAPILGLVVASNTLGSTLICLLSTIEAVFLPLRSTKPFATYNPKSSMEPEASPLSNIADSGFVHKLIQWLQCSNHTPLLKTPVSLGLEPSAQQCLELLSTITQSFREEFLQRLQIAQRQLTKRIKVLNDQKSQLISDCESLLNERENLSQKAEYLAERYEDINLKQHQLVLRVEKVTKHLQERVPVLSDEEIDMQREVQSIEDRLKLLRNSMEQINLKFSFQQSQLKKDEHAASDNDNTFKSNINNNQAKQIKDLLIKEGAAIADLLTKVMWLKKDLGI